MDVHGLRQKAVQDPSRVFPPLQVPEDRAEGALSCFTVLAPLTRGATLRFSGQGGAWATLQA